MEPDIDIDTIASTHDLWMSTLCWSKQTLLRTLWTLDDVWKATETLKFLRTDGMIPQPALS